MGDIKRWDTTYFNSGVVLASKKHKEAFNISDVNFNLNLGKFKEQNVLNWKVRKLNIPTKNLGRTFNFINDGTGIFSNEKLRRSANIIHHNHSIPQNKRGSKSKIDFMREDVNFFLSKIFKDIPVKNKKLI